MTLIMLAVARWMGILLGIEEPSMLAGSTTGIRIMAIGMIPLASAYLLSGYYLVIGKIILSVTTSFFRDLAIPVLSSVVCGYIWRGTGLFIGMAISPFITFALCMAFGYLRYGKENFPLLLQDREAGKKNYYYEFEISVENVVSVRDQIDLDLKGCEMTDRTRLRIMRLFEELFLLVKDRNDGNRTLAECAIVIKDRLLTIITRTDGKNIDLSGKGMDLDSFRSYSLSQLIKTREYTGKHISTMSFNRNAFEIDLENAERE